MLRCGGRSGGTGPRLGGNTGVVVAVVDIVAESALDVQPEPLERVLAAVEWSVRSRRRPQFKLGERVFIGTGAATLGYVVSGHVSGMAGEEFLDLPAGGALVSMGREPYALRAEADTEIVLAELRPSSREPSAIALMPDVLGVSAFARIEPTISEIARDIGHPPEGIHRAADSTICALMVTTVVLGAIRAWAEAGCAPADWPARSADPFLARVIDAIHEDPGHDWSVEKLAAIGAMSRSVFAHRFRAATGQTPAAYLNAVRIEAAKPLLAAGGSVSDAARRLGYASDEGFSRAFRRRTGVRPSAWRQRTSRRRPAETNNAVPTPTRIPATT